MINIGELTRYLSVSEDAGVLVTRLDDEPPGPPGSAPVAARLGHKFPAYPLPDVPPVPQRPELYLG
jgi:hypothetical protein